MGEATSPDSRPISAKDALPEWGRELRVESWDDLRDLGSSNIGSLIDALGPDDRTNYGDTKADKIRKQAVVDAIKEHTQGVEEKPYIPSLRPEDDYFKEGQRVMVFTPRPTPESRYDFIAGSQDFVPGEVQISGQDHIQVHTDEPCYRGPRGLEIDVVSGGKSSPSFITQEDFDYLTTHPDYLSIWLNNLDGSRQKDLPDLKATLKAKAEVASIAT